MDKFNYLLKRRATALGLFARVAVKLRKLEDEILMLISDAHRSVKDAEEEAGKHREAISYLNTHLEETQKSRLQVERFLPTK